MNWQVVLLGLLLFCGSMYELYAVFSAMRWEKTVGKIVDRKFEQYGLDVGWRHREISYSFEVNGYNYVSSNFTPGVAVRFVFRLPFLPRDFFAIETYENGKEVTVIYDPKNPRRCAIKDGDVVWPTILGISGLLILLYEFLGRIG